MNKLNINRDKWESSSEIYYEMVFKFSAFNHDSGTYRIFVEQKAVQTALLIDDEQYKTSDHFIFTFATVEKLFIKAEDVIANAEEYKITYHAELGYPTQIVVDYNKSIADDESSRIVSELFRSSDTACTLEAKPARAFALSLAGQPDADVCDAVVYLEDGDYTEQLEACSDNVFYGAFERAQGLVHTQSLQVTLAS
jgi:hypothetical protein